MLQRSLQRWTFVSKTRRNQSAAAASSPAPLPPADAVDIEPEGLDPDEDCLDVMAVDLHQKGFMMMSRFLMMPCLLALRALGLCMARVPTSGCLPHL
eukprot:2751746-Amphidinium_carterae.1